MRQYEKKKEKGSTERGKHVGGCRGLLETSAPGGPAKDFRG